MARKAPAPAKRPRGRPAKPEGERKRGILAMRIRDEMKATLSRRAAANRRSVSEEAEALLEQALQTPAVLDQALDLAFGRQVSGLILALARLIREVSNYASFASIDGPRPAINLFSDPYVFDQAVTGITRLLEAMRPEGEISIPKFSHAPNMTGFWRLFGVIFAGNVLHSIMHDPQPPEIEEWAAPIREKLGVQVVHRIQEFIMREQLRADQLRADEADQFAAQLRDDTEYRDG
jgi:plasmid stability protein